MSYNCIKNNVLKAFADSVRIGDTVTKGQIFQTSVKVTPTLYEATVGWIISIWLVNTGRMVEVGNGKYGAKIYKRVS